MPVTALIAAWMVLQFCFDALFGQTIVSSLRLVPPEQESDDHFVGGTDVRIGEPVGEGQYDVSRAGGGMIDFFQAFDSGRRPTIKPSTQCTHCLL